MIKKYFTLVISLFLIFGLAYVVITKIGAMSEIQEDLHNNNLNMFKNTLSH